MEVGIFGEGPPQGNQPSSNSPYIEYQGLLISMTLILPYAVVNGLRKLRLTNNSSRIYKQSEEAKGNFLQIFNG